MALGFKMRMLTLARKGRTRVAILLPLLVLGWVPGATGMKANAQASSVPSAAAGSESHDPDYGRKLLDQMVEALGGAAWLNRTTLTTEGRGATFYKGAANPYVSQFEEHIRLQPFGERIVIVSKMGAFIPTSKRDVAEVWTQDAGYEVTFRGRKALPEKDVDEFVRRQRHSLEVLVRDWLHQPGVIITYEGTGMIERKLADKVSVLTADNDGAVLQLENSTHLPISLTYQWRDALYKDLDTEQIQYSDYHPMQGIMTPLTITRVRNGDMTAQRFLTKVTYNLPLAGDLFDPDRPLAKSVK